MLLIHYSITQYNIYYLFKKTLIQIKKYARSNKKKIMVNCYITNAVDTLKYYSVQNLNLIIKLKLRYFNHLMRARNNIKKKFYSNYN